MLTCVCVAGNESARFSRTAGIVRSFHHQPSPSSFTIFLRLIELVLVRCAAGDVVLAADECFVIVIISGKSH